MCRIKDKEVFYENKKNLRNRSTRSRRSNGSHLAVALPRKEESNHFAAPR